MRGSLEAVVVTYNSAAHVRACLGSLAGQGTSVLVIDNGSNDGTLGIVDREFPAVRTIVSAENCGYGKALNLGIARTHSEFVLVANADTVFPAGAVHALASFLETSPRAGVVGPQQVFPDGKWQRSYGRIPGIVEALQGLMGITSARQLVARVLWPGNVINRPRRVGYVDGAVMMLRRSAFDEVRGFDEHFYYYGEDSDLCFRLKKAGWDVMSLPRARVTHVRGGSSIRVEGFSEKFLRAYVNASVQFARRHYRGWHAWLYLRLRALQSREMVLVYRFLKLCASTRSNRRASAMAATFELESRIWSELAG